MKKVLYIISAVWFVIIVGFIASCEYTLRHGREVLLKTVPVDPRDLFMGDYVILNYEVAQIDDVKYYFPRNKIVYVSLEVDDNNVAHIKDITEKSPKDGLYLKGKTGGCSTALRFFGNGGTCINYGIESYYVKEKTGLKLERDLRSGTYVKVMIDKNGNAKVTGFEKL